MNFLEKILKSLAGKSYTEHGLNYLPCRIAWSR
jgi:hypothetical protein